MLIILVNCIEKGLISLINDLFIVVWDRFLIIELLIKFDLVSQLIHLKKLEHVMVTQFVISTNIKNRECKFLPQLLATLDEFWNNLYKAIQSFSPNLANVGINKLHYTFLKLLTVSDSQHLLILVSVKLAKGCNCSFLSHIDKERIKIFRFL